MTSYDPLLAAALEWSPSHADLEHGGNDKVVDLLFKDVKYTINADAIEVAKRIPVIKGVSGIIPGGRITAVFGSTGAGKSTLMEVLACRKRPAWVTGNVYVNGNPQTHVLFPRLSGYVSQDDILLDMLSVRENIDFSAQLRLPRDLYGDATARIKLVDTVLRELSLEKSQHAMIGNDLTRGVSSGERKRCNIGCELVIRPSVLFLDGPIHALDAATSFHVIETLKTLSRRGCTVLMTMHQPRFSIFELLDNMIVMCNGRISYQGHPSKVVDYFAVLGFICQPHDNPADFMFDALAGLVKRHGNYTEDLSLTTTNKRLAPREEFFIQAYEQSGDYQRIVALIDNTIHSANVKSDVQTTARCGTNAWQQFQILAYQRYVAMKRMPIIVIAQVSLMLMMGFMIGAVYYQCDDTFKGLQNRVGVAFFCVMCMMFGNLGALDILLKERVVFLHQKSNGYYTTPPYVAASLLLNFIPMRIFPMLIFGCIAYPLIGFQSDWSHFLWFEFVLVCVTIASGAVCYLVGSVTGIYALANLVLSMTYVIFMLFGGLVVNLDTLPPILGWISYLSLFKQGYNALVVNELHGLQFQLAPFVHISGDEYLKQQGFTLDDKAQNIALLLIPAGVYLMIAYVVMHTLRT